MKISHHFFKDYSLKGQGNNSNKWTEGQGRNLSQATYSCVLFHIDEQRQDNQLETTYNSSVPIQDVALGTSRERWDIETGCERGRSVLAARHDDDDDIRPLI